MTEDNNGTPPPEDNKPDEVDQIKNLKSEFSRKHKEQSEMLNQLINTQAQLQETLSKMAAPKAPPAESDNVNLDEIMYSDPKKYASIIKGQARDEALAAVRHENSTQAGVNQIISQLASEYPELSDAESELTKASVQYLKSSSEAEKMNPRTYEYAVLKAAQQLEMQPKSKRKQTEDDFVAPSYSSPAARSKKRTSDQVVSQNKDLAKAFGVDLNDPIVKEKYLNLLKNKGVL